MASQVLQALLKPFLELHTTTEGSGLMWNRRRQGEDRGRGQSYTPAREGKTGKEAEQTPNLFHMVAIGMVVSNVPVAKGDDSTQVPGLP